MTEVADEPRHTTAFLVPVKVAVVFVVVILVAFVVGGWRLNAIQQDYTRQIAHTALRSSCESGNDFRAADKSRWDGVVDLFGPPPHRADLQHVIDVIEGHTKKADQQRDCSKL